MKFSDVLAIITIIFVICLFTILPKNNQAIGEFVSNHGMIMSFFKFAVLCTIGELVALRITTTQYIQDGFGLMPRVLMWGGIGLVIHMAFVIFATGTPFLLKDFGLGLAADALIHGNFGTRLLLAFSISVFMNTLFAPVFMVAHGIVSVHIAKTGGTLKGLFSPVNIGEILGGMDWKMLWGFVFKKTIPLFWIPAHTITFLLPPELRVLFAAALGVVLGIILAFASLKGAEAPA